MRWIVIERQSPSFPVICTDEDGTPKIFDDHQEASDYADDCQDGIVVALF